MALFRKRKDPIEARSRALNDEIKRLEREIRDLGKAPSAVAPSRKGSSVSNPPTSTPASPSPTPSLSRPGQESVPRPSPMAPPDPRFRASLPVLDAAHDPLASPVGARKFDLPAAWQRWSARFTGKSPERPRLPHYLASGSVHGLRPLRYEKRVARNRFIGLFVLLVIVLTGLARVYILNLR